MLEVMRSISAIEIFESSAVRIVDFRLQTDDSRIDD